jgi:hypothetical protein
VLPLRDAMTRAADAIVRARDFVQAQVRRPDRVQATDDEIIRRAAVNLLDVLNTTPRLLYWGLWRHPRLFIRSDISQVDRAEVIAALKAGRQVVAYLGFARCRICGEILGTSDMITSGMLFPQKAEHYVREHRVWTRGCDELLRRIRASRAINARRS